MSLLHAPAGIWNRKTVLFVHGIGVQAVGYSEPLYQILRAADPLTVDATRWHEVAYDRVNDLMLAKLKLVRDQAAKSAKDKALDLGENFLIDLVNYLFTVDVFNWINAVYRKELVDIVEAGKKAGVLQRNHEITIISHSLGTVLTYELLHDILSDAQVLGLSSGFRVKTLFTLGSPIAFIKARQSLIPSLNEKSVLRSRPIARPTQANPFTGVLETNVVSWFNLRQKYDPVGSLVPLTLDSSNGALTEDKVFDKFHSGANPHDFGNYVTEFAPFLLERIRA